jgi:serine/threonine protein kinase
MQNIGSMALFADFTLDAQTGELRRNDGSVARLGDQPLEILRALLERPGEVVPREDLRRRLWPNDTVVEFEHSINAAMNRLRTALGDPADRPQIVETLARKGYRLKVPVRWQGAPEAPERPVENRDQSLLGRRVSHYRVLGILGGGGMGVVYRAEDIKLSRSVALKFLPDELALDPTAAQRLSREARATSSLNHPNICTIYDVDEWEGRPFIAMELLEGRTLRELIGNRGPADGKPVQPSLDTKTLLGVASQALAGLAAAHAKGIIHRDLKPANIFVENSGRTKILDFGIAKRWDSEAQAEVSDGPNSAGLILPDLTRTGETSGTIGYMSPEQLRGEPLDARTDLFSFGLVLHEMATGSRAFAGQTAADVRTAVLEQIPEKIRIKNPRAPGRLERVVTRALEKDREKRFQNADQLQDEIKTIERELTPLWKRRWFVIVALLPFLAGGTWFAVWRQTPPHRLWKQRQLTAHTIENPVTGGAISPDGKQLVYTDLHGIYLKPIGGGEPTQVGVPTIYQSATPNWEIGDWLPDSQHFYAIAELPQVPSVMWLFSVSGGAKRVPADGADPWGVSPDGKYVALTENHDREIWIASTDQAARKKLVYADPSSRFRAVQWSPDGQSLAFVRNTVVSGRNISQIEIVSGAGGQSRAVLSGAATQELGDLDEGYQDMKWLPDGRLIYVGGEPDIHGVSCNLWSLKVDSSGVASSPERITNWAGFCINNLTVTADGKKLDLIRSSQVANMFVADFDGAAKRLTTPRKLATSDDLSYPIAWDSDGKELFVESNRDGSWGIYRQHVDDGGVKTLVAGLSKSPFTPTISPDQKWLLYPDEANSALNGTYDLVRVPIAGGPRQEAFKVRFGDLQCGQRSGASCVIAERSPGSGVLVFTDADAVTGRGQHLTYLRDPSARELEWALAPDASRVALFAQFDSSIRILRLSDQSSYEIKAHNMNSLDATHLRTLTWASDAHGFFASTTTQDRARLAYIDLHGNVTFLWEAKGGNTLLRATPSPDGRKLAIQTVTQAANLWMIENF